MPNIAGMLLIAGVLIFFSTLASKLSQRVGVPALLMFVGIGMLAGSDGIGGIDFSDPVIANVVGTIALAYILFSGGLDTEWRGIKPILGRGLLLATVGVVVTTLVLGLFVWAILGMSFKTGLLLAAIVSSTDAAAVFSVLRSEGTSLKGNLRPLLEFESGSNDPMAIFLTISLIQLLTIPDANWLDLLPHFVIEMSLGAIIGYAAGKIGAWVLENIHLGYEGMYPVLGISVVMLVFGAAQVAHGSGFLAVYVCGIAMGNSDFMYKRALMRFHDAIGWLMQIGMFLVLGLLVFPSHLPEVLGAGIFVSAVLMFIARPLSVYLCLLFSKFSWAERTLVSWTGLRGAVPIVLATFPLLENTPQAEWIFNVVFFVVLISVILQGRSMMMLAKLLKVDDPRGLPPRYPLMFNRTAALEGQTREFDILPGTAAVGKTVAQVNLPKKALILLIRRDRSFLVPRGETLIEPYDTLLVLADSRLLPMVRDVLESPAEDEESDNE